MATKTINCAECGESFIYEPNTHYPDKRKYCDACGEIKRASYKASQVPKGSPRPDLEEEEIETVKVLKEKAIAHVEKWDDHVHKTLTAKKDNGFHLSPEQVRSNALESALEYLKGSTPTDKTVIDKAKLYEQYILTGE